MNRFENAVPVITALAGLFGVLLGFVGIYLTYNVNHLLLQQKTKEEERQAIYRKLDCFYGPFKQLLGTSRELTRLFRASRGDDFRTLTALLQGDNFEGNDKVLLDQILEINEKIDDLIIKQVGQIDAEELRRLLWRASTHYRILRLAAQGVLVGEVKRFENHVFPRDLDDKISEEITRLQKRLEELHIP